MSAQFPASGGTERTPHADALRWHAKGWVMVAANRSLGSVLRRAHDEKASWVVVVRTVRDDDTVFHYAYRTIELEQQAAANRDAIRLPLEDAMGLRERKSSATSRGRRLTAPPFGSEGPAAERVVDFDAAGRVAGIGEIPAGDEPDLGPERGAHQPASPPGARNIDVTVSAQTKAEIEAGAETQVLFRIEVTTEAMPFAASLALPVRADQPIVIVLTAENDAVEIVGERMQTVDPPASKQPREGAFAIKGRQPRRARRRRGAARSPRRGTSPTMTHSCCWSSRVVSVARSATSTSYTLISWG